MHKKKTLQIKITAKWNKAKLTKTKKHTANPSTHLKTPPPKITNNTTNTLYKAPPAQHRSITTQQPTTFKIKTTQPHQHYLTHTHILYLFLSIYTNSFTPRRFTFLDHFRFVLYTKEHSIIILNKTSLKLLPRTVKMNVKYFPLSLSFVTISFMLLLASSEASKKIPALYVFGDSLVDSGNNIYINENSTAKFPPFGIDFGGKPTGRCTNGKTTVDYLAIHLGLPFVPPYLGLSKNERNKVTTGINYACGGASILPQTDNLTLTLDTQILLFKKSIKNSLAIILDKSHLSESLFVVSSGVNDQFQNGTFSGSKKFSAYLLKEFLLRLQKLYNLGARKFFLNNIPPAGCFPSKALRSRLARGKCDGKINKAISFYNKDLLKALLDLQTQLPGFAFILADLNGFLMELRETGYKYGIAETRKPCCPNSINGDLRCHPYDVPCPNRNTHLFWDDHPSQITNQIYARRCFHEQNICSSWGVKLLY